MRKQLRIHCRFLRLGESVVLEVLKLNRQRVFGVQPQNALFTELVIVLILL